MARRNDHSRDELVEMTLTAVEQFLAEKPHQQLSLRKVAAMIGYVPSTLINVFGSYNLLLLHVVARTLDDMGQTAQEKISTCTSAEEGLNVLAKVYLDYARDNPHRWQLVFQHSMNGQELPKWHSDRIDNMTGLIEQMLEQLAPSKDKETVIEASRVLWAGVHGITLLTVDDKLFTDTPVDGDALINNLLNGYLSSWQGK
ncbi:TetR family transcriptional regulator [Veronia nyctiphanis]|uniref:TetR family transcriptional regulator n=1 Tax=Veronia nyctiphanis TaxID=1278244 RepID=A0A4Q0YTU6_9GAMM|nr:TetR-like C-terminal domain-containing protein [Veronia nyctiphanis]RXJ74712.1 TetR family transcriptional regulator [Veronia nyctiphanis]